MSQREEDVAQAELLARTANVFGSWPGYLASLPPRNWTRGANGLWRSVDPIIQRQIERRAAKEAAEREQQGVT